MNENKYPSSEMIRAFIKETNIKRTGPQIKSKLQHLMKQTK
nr:unnamed protein product [Callosobruchus chinensis]CAH7759152.1 unnamed protein product [Callosobruchus chinensis]